MTYERANAGRILAVLAGFVAFVAIAFLTLNVSREIRLLGSAGSDNVQWSLSQTEVEFLEFINRIERAEVKLPELRRKFDVFYSRIRTLRDARVFADLRTDPGFQSDLNEVRRFLDETVPLIDAPDAELRAGLTDLQDRAIKLRRIVRGLSNSGLQLFALKADGQRLAVARTLTQLAVALALLITALGLGVLHLNRRERAQKQTAMRMNTVIGTSLDGVIVSNAKGEIIEFSPAAEAIFGHCFKDVVGKDIGSIIVPDHMRDAHDAGMKRMRDNGEKRVVGKGRVTLEAKRADGGIFPVELAIQSATTDEGDIFIAYLRDISRRVADEAELVAARDKAMAGEKMKTDFMATMSHEIRTPLNGLLGNMDLLRDTSLNPAQDRFVRNMETSGRLLMTHISDVLDITRYDAGKLSTRLEPVDISSLLQDIIDNQSSMAAANETTLDWGWDGAPQHWVNSDHDRLQHVLMNLIGNAVKFTKRGRVSLTARAQQVDDTLHLRFEIRDTGPGIAPDLVGHIFDDFVTGNTAYDREVGGTGLGLSIAKRFVTALKGDIGVDSTLGAGTTFWVTLPVVPLQNPAHDPAQASKPAQGQEKVPHLNILLVEDNEINRVVAREMLEADGHSVTLAHDGQQGVHLAQDQAFDLILMDISMPVMDGRAATRAIRAGSGASAHSKIVALTANAMAEEQKNFKADGMTGILTKPLSKAALRSVLHDQHTRTETSTAKMLDLAHTTETREAIGDAAYGKLLTRFMAEVEELIDWFQHTERPDRTDIANRAHKVSGSASVFGACALDKSLKQIQISANAGEDRKVLDLIDQLPDLWRRTKTALNEDRSETTPA